MLLPNRCSTAVDGKSCEQPPAYTITVSGESGEFLIGVVCNNHRGGINNRLIELQKLGKVPIGELIFQPIKIVSTDCVIGNEKDYVDIELNRGIDSERKIS
jgi:hypothetical protein